MLFNPSCFLWITSFTTLLLLTGFGSPRLTDRDIAPTASLAVAQLSLLSDLRNPPQITAKAGLIYEVDAGRVVFSENESAALPPASLTKLMTALLVLESGDLTAKVTVEESDLLNGATMGLRAGEVLSVEELLFGLLIPSGNDAALALARQVGGDVESFVVKMNERAREMGLSQTRFANPHGFHADEHLSSAIDLLNITRKLLAYPKFREIVRISSVEIAGHPLRNTNRLLETFPGADGIKTGTTPEAGQCLIASITRNARQLLLIILGSRNRYADAHALYAYHEANYGWRQRRLFSHAALNRVQDAEKRTWYITSRGEAPSLQLDEFEDAPLTLYRRILPPSSGQPWYSGMPIGYLEWRRQNEVVGTQRLVLR